MSSIVVLPLHDPGAWLVVAVATATETTIAMLVLRRLRIGAAMSAAVVAFLQLATWVALLAFLSWVLASDREVNGRGMIVLLLMRAIAEVPLVRAASRGSREVRASSPPLTVRQAVIIVGVGNVAAIAAIFGTVPLLRGLAS